MKDISDMRKTILLALIALAAVSCEETITTEKDRYEFGEPGAFIEIELKDGRYVPKSAPVTQEVFDALFKDSWRIIKVTHVASDGNVTNAGLPSEYDYQAFSVRDGGVLRAYDGKGGYVDGTYTYDPSSGIISFTDVLTDNPEFRLISLSDNEMSGAFPSSADAPDKSVLTICVYSKLSPGDPIIQY